MTETVEEPEIETLPEGWADVTLGDVVQPSPEKVEPSERPVSRT